MLFLRNLASWAMYEGEIICAIKLTMLLLAIFESQQRAVLTANLKAMMYTSRGSAPFSIAPLIDPVISWIWLWNVTTILSEEVQIFIIVLSGFTSLAPWEKNLFKKVKLRVEIIVLSFAMISPSSA